MYDLHYNNAIILLGFLPQIKCYHSIIYFKSNHFISVKTKLNILVGMNISVIIYDKYALKTLQIFLN